MKKTIIILVISCVAIAVFCERYFINSNNIDKELVATEQLLKVQGDKPDTIRATLEMIRIGRQNERRSQLLFISFGALIGALLSFFATEITSWRQRKYSKIEKEDDLKNEIIGGALKFLFKSADVINDLWADRELLEKVKKDFPEKQSLVEQKMFKRFHANISQDFFNELNFHSFQIKRLTDRSIWQDFEKLMNKSRELTKFLADLKPLDECKLFDVEYKNLKKDFVENCIKLTKINEK